MKKIDNFLSDKLNESSQYTCQPSDKHELLQIIVKRLMSEGYDCDLNDIDTSKITDMSDLFDSDNDIYSSSMVRSALGSKDSYGNYLTIVRKFNGDISKWDVSNVTNMEYMFNMCWEFTGDLSKWNVSKVEKMECMFWECKKFNQDLNSWDISSISNANRIVDTFKNCPTQPEWYINKIQ